MDAETADGEPCVCNVPFVCYLQTMCCYCGSLEEKIQDVLLEISYKFIYILHGHLIYVKYKVEEIAAPADVHIDDMQVSTRRTYR